MNTKAPQIFDLKPQSAQAWNALYNYLQELQGVSISEKRTCLHIDAFQGAFLGIHPRKHGLRINIVLDHELDSPRVVKCERVSKSRFHNEVDLKGTELLDPELRNWILEAYELQERRQGS